MSYGCVPKASQKLAPLPGLAEVRREFYLRRLLEFGAAAAVLLIVALILWSALTARFDERYALELLSKHDAEVVNASFKAMATEEGSELFSSAIMIRNGTFVGREATISFAEDGNASRLVSSDAVWFGLRTPDIGRAARSWTCPEGTWLNMSVEESGRYLYVGAKGNWLMLSIWRQKIAEWNWTDEALAAAAQAANVSGASLGAMAEAVKAGSVAMTWYFAPGERAAYDAKVAELAELAAECEEVAV